MGTYAECKAAFEAIEASSMWTNYNLGNMNFQNFNAEVFTSGTLITAHPS